MADNKKTELLTKEQQAQLQNMVNDMLDIASNVIEEYKDAADDDNIVEIDFSDFSSLSGSLTQIHEDSPFLDELLKGDSWKRVIKNIPTTPTNNEDGKDAS
jgi:hypothetical protein